MFTTLCCQTFKWKKLVEIAYSFLVAYNLIYEHLRTWCSFLFSLFLKEQKPVALNDACDDTVLLTFRTGEQMLPPFCEKGHKRFDVNTTAKVIKNEIGPASHIPV